MNIMDLKKLNDEDIINVYNNHMRRDFPIEELKPVDVIQKLVKKENYICYGLYDNGQLLAYAFLVSSKSYILIDYYSVCEEYRNKGIGSKFLNILKEKCKDYHGIMVEVEKIECAPDETEKSIRKRRIDFYKRNGMIMTNISCELFGVNFSIMCLCNMKIEDLDVFEALQAIYKDITPSMLYTKYVKISRMDTKNEI